jgi:hypothetical protein
VAGERRGAALIKCKFRKWVSLISTGLRNESTSASHDKPENEAPEKRQAAVREDFFIGRDNIIAAASLPCDFVTRSSSGEANSHNNLTEDTQERHDHQN